MWTATSSYRSFLNSRTHPAHCSHWSSTAAPTYTGRRIAVPGVAHREAAPNMSSGMPLVRTTIGQYQVKDEKFHDIIYADQLPRVIAEMDFPFAHEAPVCLRGLNKLFFVSNRLGDQDSPNQHIELRTLDLGSGKIELLPKQLAEKLPMPNGATNWPGTADTFVLLTQGHCDVAPAINKVNLRSLSCEVMLNSYNGRQFNSPNDVVVYKDGTIWFTDPPYGHTQNFRPEPALGNKVYAFSPTTGAVNVVADNFVKPNGIVFSPDFKTAYVTDTGCQNENVAPMNQTIFAFDVVEPDSSSTGSSEQTWSTPTLQNRRVFVKVESEQPDGIKVDASGNVYTGTKGGIEVFAPSGNKLGTINIGHTTNLAFVNDTIYALCETKIVAVRLKMAEQVLP